MPATAAWLASLEALLNRYIGGSAQARSLAQRLHGTSLQIDIEGVTQIRARVFGGRLALLAGEPPPEEERAAASASGDGAATPVPGATAPVPGSPTARADAVISGTPPALLALLKGGARRDPARPAAQVRGDAEIANLYRELFMAARPDLEEELSRFIGDFPARRVSLFARRALDWGLKFRRTAGDNIAEYLQEESRDLVNKTELEEFLRGVDGVRETTDRIEARLGLLEQRLKGLA
jgi:ubiquinone biosynthesis protein UbiJ